MAISDRITINYSNHNGAKEGTIGDHANHGGFRWSGFWSPKGFLQKKPSGKKEKVNLKQTLKLLHKTNNKNKIQSTLNANPKKQPIRRTHKKG